MTYFSNSKFIIKINPGYACTQFIENLPIKAALLDSTPALEFHRFVISVKTPMCEAFIEITCQISNLLIPI